VLVLGKPGELLSQLVTDVQGLAEELLALVPIVKS
jgi:hypothetical protein